MVLDSPLGRLLRSPLITVVLVVLTLYVGLILYFCLASFLREPGYGTIRLNVFNEMKPYSLPPRSSAKAIREALLCEFS